MSMLFPILSEQLPVAPKKQVCKLEDFVFLQTFEPDGTRIVFLAMADISYRVSPDLPDAFYFRFRPVGREAISRARDAGGAWVAEVVFTLDQTSECGVLLRPNPADVCVFWDRSAFLRADGW